MTAHNPTNPAPGASGFPSKPAGRLAKVDAYAAMQMENLCLQVRNYAVRQFLETLLTHPDIQMVLATPIRENAISKRLLVEAVQAAASQAQSDANEYTQQRDAVYVTTILLAVDYWMYPFLMGKYDTPLALKRMVEPALQVLSTADRQSASVITSTLRWTEFDEEPEFMDWLEQKVQWLRDFLKLSAF